MRVPAGSEASQTELTLTLTPSSLTPPTRVTSVQLVTDFTTLAAAAASAGGIVGAEGTGAADVATTAAGGGVGVTGAGLPSDGGAVGTLGFASPAAGFTWTGLISTGLASPAGGGL